MDPEATVTLPQVHIHYRRPPDRMDVFVQELVLDAPEVKITFQPDTPIGGPVRVGDTVILEPGSPVVWFTFPGRWHDIGRFHTADGTFTGIYANVLTPCALHREGDAPPLRWETTDLFLDVWQGVRGEPKILDEPELSRAVQEGHVLDETAERARAEARRILDAAEEGSWPPPVVREWTLARALLAR